MRILVIEDDQATATNLQLALKSENFVCDITGSGEDGLEIARHYEYDLILLDLMLPDIDGYEVARRLRSSAKSELARVPIIAVTANALKGDAQKALDAGCDVYMSKPINIRELWARVEAFVPSPS